MVKQSDLVVNILKNNWTDFSNLKEGDYKKLFNEDLNEINNIV